MADYINGVKYNFLCDLKYIMRSWSNYLLKGVPGCVNPNDSNVAEVHTLSVLEVFTGTAFLAVLRHGAELRR